MAALDRPVVKPRPVYLNLLAIRQPLPAIVSILLNPLLFAALDWFLARQATAAATGEQPAPPSDGPAREPIPSTLLITTTPGRRFTAPGLRQIGTASWCTTSTFCGRWWVRVS